MDIECTYLYNNNATLYYCKVMNQQILPDAKLKFIGEHKDGKTNNNVRFVSFEKCTITKIPQGLTDIFPNLKGLQIFNSGLKDINRSDFLEYKNCKLLFFGCNNIEYLPGDLFADCKKLEKIVFRKNPLTTVEPIILDGLEHLKLVNMNGKNIKYGLIDSETVIALDDPKLLQIKLKLFEEYHKTTNQKMKTEIEKLRKDNQEFTKFKTFFQTDDALKDFCINIDDKQFRVHKALLAIRSSTLADTLRNNPEAENLNLVDISVDIFEGIIKFLYTDELPEEIDFIQLFAAADNLKIDDLKEYTAKKILEQLDHENAPEVLSLGSKYNHDGMKQKAFEKIKQKYPNVEVDQECLNNGKKIEKVVEYFKKMRDVEKELVDSLACEV